MIHQNQTTPREPEVSDLAYAAGLFDGEGCIFTARRNHGHLIPSNFTLGISINMTNPAAIDKIQEWFQFGHRRIQKMRNPKWRPLHQWCVYSVKAFEFLRLIYPYITVKKPQAALAFKFRQVQKEGFRQKDAHRVALLQDLREQISALNQGKIQDTVETKTRGPQVGEDIVQDAVMRSKKNGDVLPATKSVAA